MSKVQHPAVEVDVNSVSVMHVCIGEDSFVVTLRDALDAGLRGQVCSMFGGIVHRPVELLAS